MTPVRISAILDYAMTPRAIAAVAAARDAVDEVLQSPPVFRPGAPRELYDARLAAATLHADAHLEAVDVAAAALADEVTRDCVLGERLRAIAALHARISRDASALMQSPPRVLAAWHIRATAGLGLLDSERGQPREIHKAPLDPLNAGLSICEPAAAVGVIVSLLTSNPRGLPPIAQAGLVHLAVTAGGPFAAANGPLGRAAAHAVLIARGTDPAGRVAVIGALSELGRPAYVRALRAAAVMTDEAIDDWVSWWCEVVGIGAGYSAALMHDAMRDIEAQQQPV